MAPTRSRATVSGQLLTNIQRGKNLVCGGYIYHANRKVPAKNKIYWRCVRDHECNGSAITPFEIRNDNDVPVKLGKPHITHGSDPGEVQVQRVLQDIRQRARSHPNEQPLRIVQEVCGNLVSSEVIMRMPSRQTILRGVNRVQNRQRPRNPQNLNDLVITSPYDVTFSGTQFLQYDSGPGADRFVNVCVCPYP